MALCLKPAAIGQTTYAASHSIHQLLAPFNYYYFMVLIKYSKELNPEHHFQPLLSHLALAKLHKQVHNLNMFQHNLWLQGCKFQEQFNRK